jgi:hypothetical protein
MDLHPSTPGSDRAADVYDRARDLTQPLHRARRLPRGRAVHAAGALGAPQRALAPTEPVGLAYTSELFVYGTSTARPAT